MSKPIALRSLFASFPCVSALAEEVLTQDDCLGELLTIPARPFLMGNNGNEPFSPDAELPQHVVDLSTYQIGKHEVTSGQYRCFIEANGPNNNRRAYRCWSLPTDKSGSNPKNDCDFSGFRVARSVHD